uniref:Membrane protein, palmitoylated 3b (MAGUK p55 subfamily member 3) n=1 Tax=Astatotilapia calliptera TaxID=8154 RepID=A0A3P8PJ52_ASTCA
MIEAMPIVSASTGLHEILALLTSQLHPDANHKEDLVFLKDVFSEKSIGYLMKIHEKLKQYEKHSPTPVLHSASCLAEDLAEELQNGPLEDDEQELLLLLSTPHLKAVLSAHDTVAQKKFDPVLPPLPDDLDDDLEEESVKIVRLVKNKEPLGATIRRDEATGAVIVARIMRGGAADRSGLVHVGDELREVNGNLITHKRPDEISQILSQSQGSITLKIIPAVADDDKMKESKVYIRALFDYTPFEDKATPCQEAGLPFKRGDVLQVVSQEDPTWWQAKRVGDCNLRALASRLVPTETSISLQVDFTVNALLFNVISIELNEISRNIQASSILCLIFQLALSADQRRPEDTTRARKSHEREGVEYHFISKAAFEADIQNGKFIEYGEYKENLYGTSLDSIHRVLDQNKVCLVDVQPEALKTLRTAEFKPYVIFVRPRIGDGQGKQFGSSSSLSDDDLQEMKQSAEQMDECYGHWVDYVLVKEDPASALAELQVVLEKVQMEPQWVPASWVRR